MLDACLVNGFALKAIDTLTFADGIATNRPSLGPRLSAIQVVEIGADQPEYNGQFRCAATTMTTFTRGDRHARLAATTATSLSAKVAPLGWEKPFSANSQGRLPQQEPAVARRTCC